MKAPRQASSELLFPPCPSFTQPSFLIALLPQPWSLLKHGIILEVGAEYLRRQDASKQTPGITESQNHRMVGVGRDLCGSSSPTLLPKQGHLQQAAKELVQAGLEYLQRRRLHNLPGQPGPVFCHPQREEALAHVQLELPLLQFVPIAPCPVAWLCWQQVSSRSCSHRVMKTCICSE